MIERDENDHGTSVQTVLSVSDFVVISVYMLILFVISFYYSYLKHRLGRSSSSSSSSTSSTSSSSNEEQPQTTSYEYFLAERNVSWWAVGLSLFSSNIGSEHLVGLAGSGALSGLAVGSFEWLAVYSLLLLGWAFLPLYLRSKVYTTPEFLERRFGAQVKLVVTGLSLLVYIFMRISTSLYSGAVVLNVLLGWGVRTSAMAMVLATGAYVCFGGLAVVIYTEVFQSVLLLVGAMALVAIGLSQVGGWHALVAASPPSFFHMIKPADDPFYPWVGVYGALFTYAGVWYWCTDQASVQRALSARDVHHGRLGSIVAGALKITPVFFMVLPGIIARALFPSQITDETSNAAFPLMVSQLMPAGLRGLMIAAMLSALMSSLAAVFNSAATLFTMDFWRWWRPASQDSHLVWVGRITTVVVAVVSILWSPVIPLLSTQVWVYGMMISSYLSPPVMCVSVFGLLWSRANSTGALAAMVVGFVLGLFRFTLDLINGIAADHPIASTPVLSFLVSINYLVFGVCILFVCLLVMVVVSLLTPEPDRQQVELYTFFPNGFLTEIKQFVADCRSGLIWIQARGLYAYDLYFAQQHHQQILFDQDEDENEDQPYQQQDDELSSSQSIHHHDHHHHDHQHVLQSSREEIEENHPPHMDDSQAMLDSSSQEFSSTVDSDQPSEHLLPAAKFESAALSEEEHCAEVQIEEDSSFSLQQMFQRNRLWNYINTASSIIVFITITTLIIVFA